MRRTSFAGLFCLLLPSARPEQPIWAKRAIALQIAPADSPCAPAHEPVLSPDKQKNVEVLCTSESGESKYAVHVRGAAGLSGTASLSEGANEVLWSPDSKSFLINGGLSSYSGFFLKVYRLHAGKLQIKDVTAAAQQDMVNSFPPCKAWNRDGNEECKRIAANPQFNMSGIGWSEDSSAIEVIAEVPCSSSYGGIMCQVKGYELKVSDGHILNSYAARNIPAAWKLNMAWKLRIPEAPKYGAANVTFRRSH